MLSRMLGPILLIRHLASGAVAALKSLKALETDFHISMLFLPKVSIEHCSMNSVE